jgi:hypothetical protein
MYGHKSIGLRKLIAPLFKEHFLTSEVNRKVYVDQKVAHCEAIGLRSNTRSKSLGRIAGR